MKNCKKIALLLAALALLTAVLTIGIAAEEKPALDIYAANLSFEDSVYLMYAVDAENVSADQVKMLFWTEPILQSDPDAYVKGTEDYVGTNCGDVTIKDSTYKMFKYDKLHAKNMTDVIYARAYVEVDGVAYYSELSKYSILQYAYNKLGYTGTATDSDTLQEMLRNMLTYGASAQKHFEYNTDRLATDSFYQIKLEGGVLSDGCAHGLYLEGEQVGISAAATDAENATFFAWLNEEGVKVTNFTEATITVGTANATYTANYAACSQGLMFILNDDGESYSVTGIGTCTDTDIIIPATYEGKPVTAVLQRAFENRSQITSVIIPCSVTSIGASAFYACTNLATISIPDSVTTIGNAAFGACHNLTSVAIPGSVTSLGEAMFTACIGLTSVTIPNSVTSIGERAFHSCINLASIIIPDSVTSIGVDAFRDCVKLNTVYYGGTAAEWDGIAINSSNNSYLTSATRYYYSETAPTEAGNYWHWVDGKVEIWSSGDAENESVDDVVSDPF